MEKIRTISTWLFPLMFTGGLLQAVWGASALVAIGFVVLGVAGCAWLGVVHYKGGFGDAMIGNWLLSGLSFCILSFAFIYTKTGLLGPEGPIFSLRECTYFSVVTWTTLGYGDYRPTTSSQPFAAVEAFTGYVYMAFAVSIVVSRMGRRLQAEQTDAADSTTGRR